MGKGIHPIWGQPQGRVFFEPQLQFSSCLSNAPKTIWVSREGTRGSLGWQESLLGLSGKRFKKLVPLIAAVKYVAAQERRAPAAQKG
jgi:hypothetical protein